ncbi:tRNA (adenosine(37)-N6)-threonylcarbamoyltransferase complex dimerization subunit type 1 TsaB [Alicyclobacillus sp. SO9]|uniref:tRNA (adenosine(37)-N6)-threonylcarbamoyltransferase complex dimerization subunit type 1 TsaB n=1 Tax=Alicyclobacillus sp. SO9 TaxID=2665646 RepID=UPI0018E7A597|nr:tRNA (adenosine(37)-N6)-threonylcarbamoyltransferase complex dimerization subunit type 1 TsaB [Alicyclobacillus sp. SO9]
MALLVLDTATEVLAVGLTETLQTIDLPQGEPSVLLTSTSRVPRRHSVLLQPMMSGMLKAANQEPGELRGIVVGVGPGSYTGVRLGVSTAKAMAFALQIPLYPISTLFAMAAAALPAPTDVTQRVISLLYARRQRAFGAVFEKQGKTWVRLTEDRVQSLAEWSEECGRLDDTRGVGRTVVVHDFRPQYGLEEHLNDLRTDSSLSLAQIAGLLPQGLVQLWADGQSRPITGDDIHLVEPGYALPVEAEVKLKEAKVHGDK